MSFSFRGATATAILSVFAVLASASIGFAEETALRDIKGFRTMVLQLANGDRIPIYSSVETIQVIADTDQDSNADMDSALVAALLARAKVQMDERLKEVGLERIRTVTGRHASIEPRDRCNLLVLSYSVHLKSAPVPNSVAKVPIGAMEVATFRYQRVERDYSKPCEDAARDAVPGISWTTLFAAADFSAADFMDAMEPAIDSSIVNVVANLAADNEAPLALVRKWSTAE